MDGTPGPTDARSTRSGNTGIIVQARMGSARLPGKVLRKASGKPLLQYLLERLMRSGLGTVVVASTRLPGDDGIEELASGLGVACLRGDPEDVASRFRMAVEKFGFDAFARVCGDSPLLDTGLLRLGFDLFGAGGWDLVTNVFPRSYPKGQSVEVLRGAAFLSACARFRDGEEREHVTRHFYLHPEEYRIRNFSSGGDRSALQLSVDTPGDFERYARLVESMERPHWDYSWSELAVLDARLSAQDRNRD